jgi:hypothetical protein
MSASIFGSVQSETDLGQSQIRLGQFEIGRYPSLDADIYIGFENTNSSIK